MHIWSNSDYNRRPLIQTSDGVAPSIMRLFFNDEETVSSRCCSYCRLSFRAQGNIGKRIILNSLSNGYFSLNLRLPLCLIVGVVHWESTSQANSKMGQRQLRGDCNIMYPKGDYF